jgi:hypothetical protein
MEAVAVKTLEHQALVAWHSVLEALVARRLG